MLIYKYFIPLEINYAFNWKKPKRQSFLKQINVKYHGFIDRMHTFNIVYLIEN